MMKAPRLISRVALFSALIYVLSWGTAFLPNVNFIFFVVFAAGFLWGAAPGVLTGLIGMWLWSSFNPYGPAPIPIMVAQMAGIAVSGPVGSVFRNRIWRRNKSAVPIPSLVCAATLCTLAFYLPVNAVDAWLFQPFWPRFLGGLPWAAISLVSNAVVFPLLFKVLPYLYAREANLV